MKIRPVFAWYDLWVGAFLDMDRHRLYILPLPCIGIMIDFSYPLLCPKCGNKLHVLGRVDATYCTMCDVICDDGTPGPPPGPR